MEELSRTVASLLECQRTWARTPMWRVTFLALAVLPLVKGALPGTGELRRTVACVQSGRFLDITSQTRPEELPPCVNHCPFGTVARVHQCVPPALDTALQEVQLEFHLLERCLEDECGALQHWNLHQEVLRLKVAQYLRLPKQELFSALLFYPSVNTSWSLWDPGGTSENSSADRSQPGRPALRRFFLARDGEEGFSDAAGRRLRDGEKQFLVHTAFRAHSVRVSASSRPVVNLLDQKNGTVSEALGINVEVMQPRVAYIARDFAASSHDDYRAAYEFEGLPLNTNPYVATDGNSRLPGTALGFECASPCWDVSEQPSEETGGIYRCSDDCDCAGKRRCSPLGHCAGEPGFCGQSGGPAEVAGYDCIVTGSPGTGSGAHYVALTPGDCGSACDTLPTCGAIEWRGPDYCFLIAQTGFVLPKASRYGAWSICKKSTSTLTTTTSAIWQRPREADPLAELSDTCRTVLQQMADKEGLGERMVGCSFTETAAAPPCRRVSCIGVLSLAADAACEADLCGLSLGAGEAEPLGSWVQACDDVGLVDSVQLARANKCNLTTTGMAPLIRLTWWEQISGVKEHESLENGDEGAGLTGLWTALGLAAVPLMGAAGLAWMLRRRLRRNKVVRLPRRFQSEPQRVATVCAPPPQLSCGPSLARRFGWLSTPDSSGSSRASPSTSPAATHQRADALHEGHADASAEDVASGQRQAPAPKRLKSSPPVLAGHDRHEREAFWAEFGARERCRRTTTNPASKTTRGEAWAASLRPEERHAPPVNEEKEGEDKGQPAQDTGAQPVHASEDSSWEKVPGTPQSAADDAAQRSHGFGATSSQRGEPGEDGKERESCGARRTWAPGTGATNGHKGGPSASGPAAWASLGGAKTWADIGRPHTAPPKEEDEESAEASSPQALITRLEQLKESSHSERRRFFLSQCLKWHPDKNAGNEDHATKMFQVLQEKKDWFLAESL